MYKYSYIILIQFFINNYYGIAFESQKQALYLLTCSGDNEVYFPEGVGPQCGDAQCDVPEGQSKTFSNTPAGCYCRTGYSRRNCDSKCVPSEQCAKPLCSGPNERYLTDSEAPACDQKCCRLDLKRQCSAQQSNQSQRYGRAGCGCYCVEGAARDANGTCVPMVNCPMARRRCFGTNEIFLSKEEAPRCDSYCSHAPRTDSSMDTDRLGGEPDEYNDAGDDDSFAALPAVYDNDDDNDLDDEDVEGNGLIRAGCYCRHGFYRNANMQCVERRYCNVKCPGKNEIFLPHGTAPRCETRCTKDCPESCLSLLDIPEGCYCKRGYCKDQRGVCIRERKKNCGSCKAF